MIISRTPFRMSFIGGGTDYTEFINKHEGCVLNTSIDKYMYILAHPYVDLNKIQVKHSLPECVDKVSQLKHPILRKILELLGIEKGIEISSFADVSTGTGLGSTASFTVGLLHCLSSYLNNQVTKDYLAQTASKIEIDELKQPYGMQDQYAAAFGGLNFITFKSDQSVIVEPITISKERKNELKNNLLMFYTGSSRSASSILIKQKEIIDQDENTFNALVEMTALTKESKRILYSGDLDDFGKIMHEGWQLKKTLAPNITNEYIDNLYKKAITRGGALGGKLLGAGGSGYLLFYCPPDRQSTLRSVLSDLPELRYQFESAGSNIIFYDNNI